MSVHILHLQSISLGFNLKSASTCLKQKFKAILFFCVGLWFRVENNSKC
jgi:hypothetical protein